MVLGEMPCKWRALSGVIVKESDQSTMTFDAARGVASNITALPETAGVVVEVERMAGGLPRRGGESGGGEPVGCHCDE